MASPAFPQAAASIPETPLADADAMVARLNERMAAWVRVSISERVALLRACLEGVVAVADEWVAAACAAKGIPVDSELAGEEMLGGPWTTVRNIRLLIHALEQGGQPAPPKLYQRPGGQWVSRVFPMDLMDRALYTGFEAEIWMEPGAEPTQGAIYREKAAGRFGDGAVSLVLGAGNVASIGPMDALHKLFVEDEVVILKMNPVNEYLVPFIERSFKPLVDAGYLVVVYGGAVIGGHLAHHDGVHSIHMTGSDRTHDAIVWGGTPEEQARRKAADDPLLSKPISSELGCVTPLLIVPGPWSAAEMDYQARHAAAMVAHNGSFNCNAAKVLVMPKDWDLRDAFLERFKRALRDTRSRRAYYPGAQERYQGFLDRYPQAEPLGQRTEEVVPWTLIPEVPAEAGEYALTNEAFCGVIAQVDIPGADARQYLREAVTFANERCWGTLSCMMLIHPRTQRDHRGAFEQALADLRFGGIGVNVWAGVIYGLTVTTWGAFPGHSLKDIQSGRGVVHNTFLFDRPQKSVVRAPFVIKPTPLWFADHKNLRATAERILRWEAAPGWRKVPGVALNAFRG
jgi:acyl-CoA reductase-like NAD-dependent aldehyde dehydrogenase